MGDLEFDREALGIEEKKNWHDSTTFASIAQSIRCTSAMGVAPPLPESANSGTRHLVQAVTSFAHVMGTVALEYSDACAVLGSGVKSMVNDFDATEGAVSQFYSNLSDRLGPAS